MTKTVRDRLINGLIAIITGASVVLFSNFTKNKRDDNVELDKRLKKVEIEKLDKIDFTEFKIDHDKKQKESEDRIIQFMDKRFNDTQKMIEMIHKNENK